MINFFKELSHEAKVILAAIGSALVPVLTSPEMLTMLISNPLSVAIPVILPKLIASGAIGSALYNMNPKKDKP